MPPAHPCLQVLAQRWYLLFCASSPSWQWVREGGLQWQDHKSVTSVSLSMPTCKVGALKSEPCLSCHHCRPPLTQRCFAEHCQALGSVSSHWFSNQGRPREL